MMFYYFDVSVLLENNSWWVKWSGVRQNKITKGMVLAGLGEERSDRPLKNKLKFKKN